MRRKQLRPGESAEDEEGVGAEDEAEGQEEEAQDQEGAEEEG